MDSAQGSVLNRIIANTDIIVPLGIICVVMMMIIPIPKQLLDVILTFNISFAIVILLVSMFTLTPLEFSVLPSLLLITTMFRLSMNISTLTDSGRG